MKKISSFIKKIFQTLGSCIVPCLPVIIGVGMLKAILILLSPVVFNVLAQDSNTYQVLNTVTDACFYFLPVYIAVGSAEVFNTNKYLAALTSLMLLHPNFISMVQSGEKLSVFGLPIASASYANQILPAILNVWIMSYIYDFLGKHSSQNLKSTIQPLFTIILMIPIAFCLIGPFGIFLGDLLVKLVMYLKGIGPLGNAILGALTPLISGAGLGGASLTCILLTLAQGPDPIVLFANILHCTLLGVCCFALFLRDHKSETLAAGISGTIGGVSAPAIFGYVINDFKTLLSLMLAMFCSNFYAGLMGVKAYSMSTMAIFGIVSTINEGSSIIHPIISVLIGATIAFVGCYITHKPSTENLKNN